MSTWVGSIESGLFETSTGAFLSRTDDGWLYGHYATEEEGIDANILIHDLLDNPIAKAVFIDVNTGKIPVDLLPSLLLGNTVQVNGIAEMLALTPSQVQVGDVCVVREIPGGASFRLTLPNIASRSSWIELVARYVNWNDIQNKPEFDPPYFAGEVQKIPSSKHNHDDIYPRLNNRDKIPTEYIEAVPVGNRFRVEDLSDLYDLSAQRGDVASVKETGKRYQLFGRVDDPNAWIELEDPEGLVASVNGKMGNVYLDHTDVGAAEENHTHPIPTTVQEGYGNNINFIYYEGNLYYQLNGGEFRPFA
jgi:hypothetical protein